ncbi:sigma-70 family RNA polymerase sigma factor [Rhodococcus sp. NPDC058639]|uniref:sigma-70 family RNA polymerase sigma factor n=1 Tax=Rhodococcus sp. NPDC058639 TaxID=3346570 RepID=UPI00364B52FA
MERDRSAPTLDGLAAQFVVQRPKLHAIAQRTLGSPWNADDAVQETWLRLQQADIGRIRNLEAWLTTVVSRVCIDMIRRRATWREELGHDHSGEAGSGTGTPAEREPASAVLLSEDLALALHVVLDTLGPLERLALVLHDVFALSYDDIAPIVERTPATARQLASRARARVRSVDVDSVREKRESAITAFLDAARNGEFGTLLQLLDSDIELRSDDTAVHLAAEGADHGAPLLGRRISGADAVARAFAGRAELATPIHIGGVPGAAYVSDGVVHALYLFEFRADTIHRVSVIADPARLSGLLVDGAR